MSDNIGMPSQEQMIHRHSDLETVCLPLYQSLVLKVYTLVTRV